MRAIDTHAHLDFPQFQGDREQLIDQLERIGVGVINPATDLESIDRVNRLSKIHPHIWGAVGLHPTDIDAQTLLNLPSLLNDWKALRARNRKIIALGEIGLDYFHKLDQASAQKSALRQFLTFAQTEQLPVIFHCRDAYGDLRTILEDYPGIRGVVHCFSGNLETARALIDLGLMISFTANITYPKNLELREVVAAVPLDRLMIETDSPFLPPQHLRGQRNDPLQVVDIASEIAEIRQIDVTTVLEQTTRNAVSLFRLDHELD